MSKKFSLFLGGGEDEILDEVPSDALDALFLPLTPPPPRLVEEDTEVNFPRFIALCCELPRQRKIDKYHTPGLTSAKLDKHLPTRLAVETPRHQFDTIINYYKKEIKPTTTGSEQVCTH